MVAKTVQVASVAVDGPGSQTEGDLQAPRLREQCLSANEPMPDVLQVVLKLDDRHQHPMARAIVAQLMQRCRVARSQLRRARRAKKPDHVISWFEAKTEEAWDAAHVAKAMLLGTGSWTALPAQVARRQSLMDRAELYALRRWHLASGAPRPVMGTQGEGAEHHKVVTQDWMEIGSAHPPSSPVAHLQMTFN